MFRLRLHGLWDLEVGVWAWDSGFKFRHSGSQNASFVLRAWGSDSHGSGISEFELQCLGFD